MGTADDFCVDADLSTATYKAWCEEDANKADATCVKYQAALAAKAEADAKTADTTGTTDDGTTATETSLLACADATECEEEQVCMKTEVESSDDQAANYKAETADDYPASECTTQESCDEKAAADADADSGYVFTVTCGATKLV